MSQVEVSQHGSEGEDGRVDHPVVVQVNRKYRIRLPFPRVTGMQIKEAAKAEGVPIELDFLLTVEAGDDRPARAIGDGETIEVTDDMEFTANDGDDDS